MTTPSFFVFNNFPQSGTLSLGDKKQGAKKLDRPTKALNPDFKFEASESVGQDVPFGIVDHKSEINKIAKCVDLGIFYSTKNKKVFGLSGNKKYSIVQNKTGEHLTDKDFGSGFKPYDGECADKPKDQKQSGKNQADLIKKIDALTEKIEANDSEIIINKLKKKVNKLNKKIKSLENTIDSLGSGSSSTDSITGLEPRIKNLEAAVKLDPVEPSSTPGRGISYYINRNWEETRSNYNQIGSLYDSIFKLQDSISPNTDWSKDNNIDLMATINALTARVDALEG